VGGVFVYRAALSDLDRADDATDIERHAELVDSARSKRLVAAALTGGGLALIGAGVIRFIVHDRRTEQRQFGVAPRQGGGVVTWTVGF
jgi:hypothetical protein